MLVVQQVFLTAQNNNSDFLRTVCFHLDSLAMFGYISSVEVAVVWTLKREVHFGRSRKFHFVITSETTVGRKQYLPKPCCNVLVLVGKNFY